MKNVFAHIAALGAFLGAVAVASPVAAADRYVSRPLTLPPRDFAFDLGLGVGHFENRPGSITGTGMNLEMAVGITRRFELGFRTGLRFGDDGRVLRADQYGRLYDTETFNTGTDVLANPELRFTGKVLDAEVVELALEGRVYLPFEHIGNQPTHFGGAFGVPILFHLARIVRIDTGAYIVTIFDDPLRPYVSIPGRFWFQVSDRVWLGPISDLRHEPARNNTNFLFGFGLGYQITSFLDFKTQFYFPSINNTTNAFGFGAGVQIRIE